MQSRKLKDYPSKPLGLYAAMEWGLKNVKFLSPFSFCGSKDGKEMTFHTYMEDHDKNFDVFIPEFTEDYIILFIPNKAGDNSIVLTLEDCLSEMGNKVSMEWLAKRIKRKWAMEYSVI